MRLVPVLLAVVVAMPTAACQRRPAAPDPARSTSHTITVDGEERTFELYRPAGLDGPAPLVLMLHGGFGSSRQAQSAYGWDQLAARERFVVAYPDGLGRAWNVGGGCCGASGRTGVDDVAYILSVLNEIFSLVHIDSARIYATGMSNGAMMSYRLACDTAVFAAVAPVAGTQMGECRSPTPISLIHVHGLADPNVRFDGEPGSGVGRIDGPPVPEVLAHWRATGKCAEPVQTTAGATATLDATCPGGRTVRLITIDGVGHTWPERTTETVWEFFKSHPLT